MSVRVHTYTTTTISATLHDNDGNEIEVDLDFEPWGSDVEYYGFRSTDGALVVGYLAYDDTGTSESPLEWFGEVTKEENRYGGSFSGYRDAYSAVEDRLYADAAEAYLTENKIPFEPGAYIYVDLNELGIEVPEPTDEQVFEEFSTGDPDVYRYALLENMRTSQPWATLVTDPDDLANAEVLIEVKRSDFEKPEDYVPSDINSEWNDVWGKDRADKQMGNVMEEYSAWFRGEVYGCVVQVFRPDDDGAWNEVTSENEASWNYVGSEWAKESLKHSFDYIMGQGTIVVTTNGGD